jgi:signal transduction histidine kinase
MKAITMKIFLKIAEIAGQKVKQYGDQYKSFAIFSLIYHPFALSYEVFIEKNSAGIFLRILAITLCLILLFKDRFFKNSEKFIPIFWYFILAFSLPMITTFLLINSGLSLVYLINFNIGAMVLILLVDWVSFLVIQLLGTCFGILLYYNIDSSINKLAGSDNIYLFLYMLLCIVMIGIFFHKNKKIASDYLQRFKYQTNDYLEEQVRIRTIELQKDLAAKTTFLNNVSHEIRTPVAGFLGLSDALVNMWNEIGDDKKFKHIQDIAGAADRLASLIGTLLDLARFSGGKMVLNIEKIDIKTAIDEMIEECHLLYMTNRILELKFINDAGITSFDGDYERISQVLRNLYYNAIKFTNDNHSITTRIINSEIIYEDAKIVQALHFFITDQGIGIPKDELESIFEAFVMSSRTKNRSGGTGLGLSIVKEIIDAHHGKIWAENNKLQGATFQFVIPMDYDKTREGKKIILVKPIEKTHQDENHDLEQNIEVAE